MKAVVFVLWHKEEESMGSMDIDRRTFVGAMGALGALSAALGSQPRAAVAA